MTERPLWTPSEARIGATNMRRFADFVAQRYGANATDYETLWSWSIANSEKFWTAVWDFCGVKAETRGTRVLSGGWGREGARTRGAREQRLAPGGPQAPITRKS